MAKKKTTEQELIDQTKKWMKKLDAIKIKSGPSYLIDNIKAYRNDTEHFLEKGDYVRAFEAIVWAWSFATIGKELCHLELEE